ncbi:hypothetical protein AKJ09_03522 [Labilithrix luteola]|uniref:Uncharacterized protein n=1 Tax=Labilithrix luteola TaxID=1391654 RepID=A0A0K1PTJ7_9BACT|nr:hypothetical protein AKJ09_03522 [Labilithrix luteola]
MNPFTGARILIAAVPERKDVFEVELRGQTVVWFSQKRGGRPRTSESSYGSRQQAQTIYQQIIARQATAKGLKEVGPSQHLGPAVPEGSGSTLLLDELFAAGDPRVVDEVLGCTSQKKLGALAKPWFEAAFEDVRPEMRRALLRYVDDGCDRHFHRQLVKRLFKLAEQRGDDELMAHFLVAFDRLSRRIIVEGKIWSRGSYVTRSELASNPALLAKISSKTSPKAKTDRFTRATRHYLARRVFRYFRTIGRSDPARYGKAMRLAMPLYRDEHLDSSARLLDAWSLVHVLFAWSDVIVRDPRGIRVAEGRAVSELSPAPYWPAAWRGVRDELFEQLGQARSRTVRVWTARWLEKEYAGELQGLPIAMLRPLLASPHDEVVAFAAKLLASARGLDTVSVDEWLGLLRIENFDVVPMLVDAFEKHVSPKRVSLEQCIELALSRMASVAELGLRWARQKATGNASEIATIGRVAQATVASVRTEGAAWLLALLDASAHFRPEQLRDLFDSRFADVRTVAAEYLEKKPKDASGVPLWFSLLESPYDDVRALVVKNAATWQQEAGPDELAHLASTVILAVHTGANTKQSMLRRIADRAAEKPAEADRWLPVLSFALRSVRVPERVGALAALTRAAVAHDELRSAIERHLPELSIGAQVAR